MIAGASLATDMRDQRTKWEKSKHQSNKPKCSELPTRWKFFQIIGF